MPMHQWRFLLNSLFFLVLTLSYACIANEDQIVRVGLVRYYRNVSQVAISSSADFTVTQTGSNGKLASCTSLDSLTLTAGTTQINLKRENGSSADVGTSITITPNIPSGTININSLNRLNKQYRGAIEVTFKSGYLQLINIVNIEDYLPGVLAAEMPSSYPEEALKAQAIAARSYTLRARHKHESMGYDLCDDTHCQVYDGTLQEKPRCTQAILATKGQILTYNGFVASTMYCADCGGITECYSEAHSDSVPYLASVIEPAGIPHCTWERSYTFDDISQKLLAGGIKEAAGLQKISISKLSPSGRVLAVEITGVNGSTTISSSKLRALLGRDNIKSTLFTIDATSDGMITFNGKGFGHGVGLCQVGAKALASPPYSYTYEQILMHYYPGTTLSPALYCANTKQTELNNSVSNISRKQQAPIPRKAKTIIDVRVVEPAL